MKPVSGRLVISWSSIWMPCLGTFLTASFYVRATELNPKTRLSVDSEILFDSPWSSSACSLQNSSTVTRSLYLADICSSTSRLQNTKVLTTTLLMIPQAWFSCVNIRVSIFHLLRFRIPLKFCTKHVNYTEVTLYVLNSQR